MSKELLDFMTWVNQDKKLGYTSIGIERIVNKYITLKERYNQIIDEVYNKYLLHTVEGVKNGFDRIKGYLDGCLIEFDGEYKHFSNPSFQYGYRPHTQEEFINKCKTDPEFSEKWGLQIEERELSLEERHKLALPIWKEKYGPLADMMIPTNVDNTPYKIPTKLITITYNNETIEIVD